MVIPPILDLSAFAHDRGDRDLDLPDLFVPPASATETDLDTAG